VLCGVAGCAGNPPADATSIAQAQRTIEEAEGVAAQRYAPRELDMAREKLAAAQEAQEDGDEERATSLAQMAELDADYAAAVAENEEMQEAVQELRDTLATLESELQRGQASPGVGGETRF
jgi:chromosome segregation ATPase